MRTPDRMRMDDSLGRRVSIHPEGSFGLFRPGSVFAFSRHVGTSGIQVLSHNLRFYLTGV